MARRGPRIIRRDRSPRLKGAKIDAMFQPSQHDVRSFFCETYRKQREQLPLSPMEASAVPPAAAPEPPPAPAPERVIISADKTISTGVAAIVNDYVISNYDLDQRTALFVATSAEARPIVL